MKKLLLAIVMLASTLKGYSDSPVYLLVARMHSGERVEYMLDDLRNIKMKDSTITLFQKDSSVEYEADDVAEFTIEIRDVSGIIPVNKDSAAVRFSSNSLVISEASPFADVKLFSLDGTIIRVCKTDKQGFLRLTFDDFNPGVYVVKIGNNNFKFLKQ